MITVLNKNYDDGRYRHRNSLWNVTNSVINRSLALWMHVSDLLRCWPLQLSITRNYLDKIFTLPINKFSACYFSLNIMYQEISWPSWRCSVQRPSRTWQWCVVNLHKKRRVFCPTTTITSRATESSSLTTSCVTNVRYLFVRCFSHPTSTFSSGTKTP